VPAVPAVDPENQTFDAIVGTCLKQRNGPKKEHAHTWRSRPADVNVGIACRALVVAAKDNAESPLQRS
jgi:hypothetical protein